MSECYAVVAEMGSSDQELIPDLDDASSSSPDGDEESVDGWEDVDGDTVPEVFVSLFDNEQFDSITAMFDHCKVRHQFDVWQLQRQHDLDFLGLVKLVNYVRKSARAGDLSPDLSPKLWLEDDVNLLPTMESDAVLYNLEDILTQAREESTGQIEELQDQIRALQARFDAYRKDVTSYLGHDFENKGDGQENPKSTSRTQTDARTEVDADYFHSYSFNSIHETMIKDRIRTDAYRDFIYDNKDLFKDKVVLDVGCGTGILSMFCAKAGARQVIAVDNSHIISTAREIIKANKLDHIIQCLKGTIEEVQLSVEKVDIIVSEWMGYGLLYESMLDSVIHARDKYLAPSGLMVPSHASMELAVLADSDLKDDHIDFWNDIYGFDMRPMIGRAREECLIKTVSNVDDVVTNGTTFRLLDLHTVSVNELDFEASFELIPNPSAKNLDGFVVWFDIFFARSSDTSQEGLNLKSAKDRYIKTFSTGPFSKPTHWEQGICFASSPLPLECKSVKGEISIAKGSKHSRGLKIMIDWQVADSERQKQLWHIV